MSGRVNSSNWRLSGDAHSQADHVQKFSLTFIRPERGVIALRGDNFARTIPASLRFKLQNYAIIP